MKKWSGLKFPKKALRNLWMTPIPDLGQVFGPRGAVARAVRVLYFLIKPDSM